ncbi:MAG: ISAzo13 family transposase [Verrucomicrobiae bacterium]|nr:ISAzo13 family transposase [Verrucomicrobiae bacterium]
MGCTGIRGRRGTRSRIRDRPQQRHTVFRSPPPAPRCGRGRPVPRGSQLPHRRGGPRRHIPPEARRVEQRPQRLPDFETASGCAGWAGWAGWAGPRRCAGIALPRAAAATGRGKAIPYGIYDPANNEGWVSVGIDHDTARFAVASLRRWWKLLGARRFPKAEEVLITADGGGSNSSRNRLWKVALQELADEVGLRFAVCHFPPGTSKWNKIEHRLFSFITNNWRGSPLLSYEVIVNLIASTTTAEGLVVKAAVDTATYETGVVVSDEELARVDCRSARFYGEWNYVVHPRSK